VQLLEARIPRLLGVLEPAVDERLQRGFRDAEARAGVAERDERRVGRRAVERLPQVFQLRPLLACRKAARWREAWTAAASIAASSRVMTCEICCFAPDNSDCAAVKSCA